MSIYTTDNYKVEMITKTINSGTGAFKNASVYIQRLPETTHPNIAWYTMTVDDGVAGEDFDSLDSFVANVVPKLNTFTTQISNMDQVFVTDFATISPSNLAITLSTVI